MAELWRGIPGDLHFIRQCFGKLTASVDSAVVSSGIFMKQHRAKAQVQNVWNIRVQVLFVEKHRPLLQTIYCTCILKSVF